MLKPWAKQLAKPLTSRLFARVEARVEPVRQEIGVVAEELAPLRDDVAAIRQHLGPVVARVQTHDRSTLEQAEAITELRERLGVIDDYLPVLLNAISSQNGTTREVRRAELELREAMAAVETRLSGVNSVADEMPHLQKRLEELGSMLAERIAQVERRVEFIRGEMLFEARYGSREKGMSSVSEARVVSADRLAEAGDDIRLNLGCGHIPLDGFLNVDGRPVDGIDIVAEVGSLPFDPQSVSHIHSAHLLEHFPVEELRRRLLPYWFDLLRPEGTFTAVVPDAETMLDEYAAGRFSFDDLRLVTYGEQEYEGDFHFNMFSKASLCGMLEAVGFDDVRVVECGRRNGACYEMEVAARRPGTHA